MSTEKAGPRPVPRAVDLDKTEQEFTDAATAINGRIEKQDLAVTAEEIANDRIIGLAQELSRGGIRNLTETRDEIDNLMRAIEAERNDLIGRFHLFTAHVQQAVEVRAIVAPQIQSLAADVGAALSPAPKRTITSS